MRKTANIIALLLVGFILVSCMEACGNEMDGNDIDPHDNGNISIVDMAGNSIILTEYPKSIFCQSSMFEQIILALGAESLLRASSYARTDDVRNIWCQSLYPQILDVEPAGGNQNGITNEMLISYNLDLMFVGSQDEYDEFVAIGIPCVVLDIQSLDDLTEGIQVVGKCLGGAYQEKADSIVSYCSDLLATVEEKTRRISDDEKKTAYFMESRYAASEPALYMTWGADSFQANCLKMAGINTVTDNIFESSARMEITTEQLLLSDPDIIVIGGFYEQINYDALLQDENLKTLSAIKKGQIYRAPVGASEWTRIGVESFLLPIWYGTMLYPELYDDIDISTVMQDFYQKIMGVKLTEEYQTLILAGAEDPNNGQRFNIN